MSVLILATPGDFHAYAVEWALQKKGMPTEKIFLTNVPQRDFVSFEPNQKFEFSIEEPTRTIHFSTYNTIWLRRIGGPVLPSDLHPADVLPSRWNWIDLTHGMIHLCNHADALVVNSPKAYQLARYKTYQMQSALKCGLQIPRTIVTNSKTRILDFLNSCDGDVIVKPLAPVTWVDGSGVDLVMDPEKVNVDDVENADVASAPMIYQSYIEKAFEVRITIMGRTIFAVALDSQANEDSKIDFRRIADWSKLNHKLINVPSTVEEGIFKLFSELSLSFGALDFVVDAVGNWVFLEVNEMGNFLWMESYLPELRLLDAMAQFLASSDSNFDYRHCNSPVTLSSFYTENPDWQIDLMNEQTVNVPYKHFSIVNDESVP